MITLNDENTPIYKLLGLLDNRSKVPKFKKTIFKKNGELRKKFQDKVDNYESNQRRVRRRQRLIQNSNVNGVEQPSGNSTVRIIQYTGEFERDHDTFARNLINIINSEYRNAYRVIVTEPYSDHSGSASTKVLQEAFTEEHYWKLIDDLRKYGETDLSSLV